MMKSLLRLFVLALILVTCSVQGPQGSASSEADEMAQVRLRKLHLVRPDLIHYPLQLEIVC
jgi:hypothetical protein